MGTQHTVRDGECVSSIAEKYGFFPDTIWDATENAQLKELRGDPNILFPGDQVFIPQKRTKKVEKPVDASHRFRKKGVPAQFRIQVFAGEEPRSGQKYILVVDRKQTLRGVTDRDGVLEEFISPCARRGELTIGPDQHRISIDFGTLPPITETVGIQKRLANLGFYSGSLDGDMNEQTIESIKKFQRRFKLTVSGEVDEATKEKLAEVHDNENDFPEQRSSTGRTR